METNGHLSCLSSTKPFVSPSCKHLQAYKAFHGTTSYTVLHAYYVACIAEGSSRRKAQEVECTTCCLLGSRIHACLECIHFGCFIRRHIHKHASDKKHHLAMDISSGYIYCFFCKDYKYDEEFNAISRNQMEESGEKEGSMVYLPWEPSKDEKPDRSDCRKIWNGSTLGLRGLFNLGNTCYINCIVQVFIHTPLLRDYFLSDIHKGCPLEKTCECCLMSDIFQEFYSGQTKSLEIEPLLYVVWKNISNMSGYKQRDAEEFFTAILEAMHKCCQNQDNVSVSNESDCNCIIHQIFCGSSQTDIYCSKCKTSSLQINSFWNVDLHFEKPENKCLLRNLIERYFEVETIDSACGVCSNLRNIKTTLTKLPVVLCFLLQCRDAVHSKCSSQVIFPEYLDMSSYLSKVDENDIVSGKNILTLFAVVCRSNDDSSSGHFFSYVRQHGDSWYKCNDTTIIKVEIEQVLNSQGYILFYHKRILEYQWTK